MSVSNIKKLFEQITEKFGANSNVQVIQGSLEEVIAQLKSAATEATDTVAKTAEVVTDRGASVIERLIADLNQQLEGVNAEVTHRPLTDRQFEEELESLLKGEDDRDLQDLPVGELVELVLLQDTVIEVATEQLEELRAQNELKDRQLEIQALLLEQSNNKLSVLHEGVTELKALLQKVREADAKIDGLVSPRG